jgi:hypothetical protein
MRTFNRKTKNKGVNMKPIRSNELLYLDKVINDKFYAKRKDVETEISQNAQTMSDKANKHFPKELKVDGKLKNLNQAYKQYADFIQTKELMENDLRTKVNNLSAQVEEHLDKYKQSRGWDIRFDGYDVRDANPVDYFERAMREACFEEAKTKATKEHKLYSLLNSQQEYAKNILYSGGDINTVNTELKKAFSEAEIEFQLPKSLVQLSR